MFNAVARSCTPDTAQLPAALIPTWSRDVFAAGPQRLGGGIKAVAQALRRLLAHLQTKGQAGGQEVGRAMWLDD
jgi:hypothetical protein